MNLVKFGYKVLKEEGLEDFVIKVTPNYHTGGYCYPEKKLIEIGKDCAKAIMIHEIVHAKFFKTPGFCHCSKEFMDEYKRLCEKHKLKYKKELHDKLYEEWYGKNGKYKNGRLGGKLK